MRTLYPILSATLLLFSACNGNKGAYDASGVFETIEVIVSAKTAGELVLLTLEEGQEVKAGQCLGVVDTTQLALKKAQLAASGKAVVNRRTNVKRQLASLEKQIETEKYEQVRFEKLVKSDAATRKQLDDINAKIEMLQKQHAAQLEQLSNANNSLTDEAEGIGLQMAQIEDQIRQSVVVSPIDGTILSKYAEQGEYAQPGRSLFKMANVNHMILRAYITASQLTSVKLGQQVDLFSDLGETEQRQYRGTITWISDKAEFTPKTIQTRDERANLVYAVKVSVTNDGYIKKGMYGEIRLGL